ncbi:MAG: hydrogenase, partial [Gammaproteobacteria bacterium]|nr:hydrogenase [Gammaproteobacteria bacterium]
MLTLLGKIIRIGVVTEPAPAHDAGEIERLG